MPTKEKIELHRRFWNKKGPSMIFTPCGNRPLYELDDYQARFYDPQAMWEAEMHRAQTGLDWPTDGIPTVRPNLGVIVIPSIAGQSYQIAENSMPWPGDPMSKEQIQSVRGVDIRQSEIYGLLEKFYAIHTQSGRCDIHPYLADTQGVFDIAHLLYGDHIFFDVMDERQKDWIDELMDTCTYLYREITKYMKEMSGEAPGSMVHGHGTEQGLYFPSAGIRVSEDTATLLPPEIIDELILPAIRKCIVVPGTGIFLHYCGYHPTIFDQFTAMPEIKAIDLGNPEMYDTVRLLERCAETDTVLYSRIAACEGEDWRTYVHRVGSLVAQTGARVVFRPLVFPATREECLEMQEIFHTLTNV